MSALTKLRNAGYRLELAPGEFLVYPGNRCTATINQFCRDHAQEIGQELERERRQRNLLTAERTASEIIRQFSNHEEIGHD